MTTPPVNPDHPGETALETPRTWVEFDDPAEEGQRFRCDLTWLTSYWTCIFGQGCQGIDAEHPDNGCCTLGAHFSDKDDLRRVHQVAKTLGEDEWQLHPGSTKRSAWTEQEDGATKTKVVDGGCIFLNRPGFPAGAGCALHQHAMLTGVPPHTLKPDVCWQLPIRRTYRTVELTDESSYLEVSIGEYDRRGWGPGGHDLDWYCSGNPDAHVAADPVYVTERDGLVELMGQAGYDELARRCAAHLALVGAATPPSSRRRSRHPVPDGRSLLPLLVHPASLHRYQR
ncbi:hypothetical protein GCM10027055_10200 [Janibacter alkaliphilus]|uniref:DUF3109 family protein n=1 Tax=Janibacter alkaliphilus TaxID=1069963 RepID=A0A852X567_9MICO|nr:hypothetical protein [Janibacter alkaliphilus]NYG35913.1 hypothetical protein [Janibacter alkaliphilus]